MVDLSGRRAYLDANTIIYAVEGVSTFWNLKPGLLDKLDAGAFIAITSELTLVETITGPRKAGRADDEAVFRKLLTPSRCLTLEPITLAVLEKAIELRAQSGLKTPDAIHLATGVIAGSDLFVSADKSWSRVGVMVVDPADIG